MSTYFSTFISGFSEFINLQLSKDLPDVKVEKLDDGLVIYQTSNDVEKIKKVRYFNNSYLLLNDFKGQKFTELEKLIKEALVDKELINNITRFTRGKRLKFRIIFSKENKLTSVNKMLHAKLEKIILNNTNLILDRSLPDFEFWFFLRKDGLGLFGIRLTKQQFSEKNLAKGQLRSQLASMLILLSDPKDSDIFLDPFAGFGSIPLERIKLPYKEIIAVDKDKKLVERLVKETKGVGGIKVETGDATNLINIGSKTIDKIVTDPPWGKFEKINLENLYTNFLSEANRVLKSSGTLVLLVSQEIDIAELLKKLDSFFIESKMNILVNGQKASVHKLNKIPAI